MMIKGILVKEEGNYTNTYLYDQNNKIYAMIQDGDMIIIL